MERPTQRLDEPGGNPPTHSCPKCDEVMIQASVATVGPHASSVILERWLEDASLQPFQSKQRQTGCAAWVCVDCGYTEFYALQPRKLLE